jgi:hypothetical protein
MKEKLHVYTFEAKNLPNPMTRQQLPQELRGEHPFQARTGAGVSHAHLLVPAAHRTAH